MNAVAQIAAPATQPTAIAAAVAAIATASDAASGHLGTASELVTEHGTFRTVEELTAHCTIGYYTSDQLYRSTYNVRPAPADIKADVRQLAALIAHQGLLQNLIGFIDAEGKIAVVAGERRRNAINLNIEEGVFPEDFAIPVLIITEAEATAVSLAENSGRKDMHHADLSEAIMKLKKAGASVSDVAVCFGLDEMIVRRRLRLADLSPVIFDLYRKDEMSFEQIVPYTLVDDHAKQEAALSVLGPKAPAWKVRDMLTAQKVDIRRSAIAQFVGIEAFEQAGGVIVRDLFSVDGGGYIEDVALLEKLAFAKLEPEAEAQRVRGFAWVDVKLSVTSGDLEQYASARWTTREPTAEEAAELEKITAMRIDLETQIDALENSDEEHDHDKHAALSDELSNAYDAENVICEKLNVIIDEDKPLAGALVFIDGGKVNVRAGLIKPEDKKKMAKLKRSDVQGDTTSSGGDVENAKVRAVHSEALMHNLTTHRTLALRAELMDRPDVAIVLVTHKLMCRAFSTELHSYHRGTMSSMSWDYAVLDKEAEAGKAGQALAARRAEIWAMLPQGTNPEKLLTWLLEQDQATVWKMFAYCSALSFDATARKEAEKCEYFAPVANVLSLDMANWWEAGEDYFGRVNLARIVEVVKTASTEVAAKMEKMKKGEAVKAAVAAMKDKRWLPDFLRT